MASIETSIHCFHRVVISVTAPEGSDDVLRAREFQRKHPSVEVICTGRELPTMAHQEFWIDYLEASGLDPQDWIYWLAYDDQVRPEGISRLVDDEGDWILNPNTAYIGPWAMRHESADDLWNGRDDDPMEIWTSFPVDGPTRMPLLQWIRAQLAQPTYMQMSGSVMPFSNYRELRDGRPRKQGPMRIEMATAAGRATAFVAEFDEPISIIYGRSNSDRASYGKAARREDVHLIAWLAQWVIRHADQIPELARIAADQVRARVTRKALTKEEWRVRGVHSKE